MYAISLGGDGAELRPLEPWRAEEFLAHVDRGRELIGRYIGLADAVTDLESSRAFLQSYAEKTAADAGRIHGIWSEMGACEAFCACPHRSGAGVPQDSDGKLVGGVLFRTMDVPAGNAEAGCWLEPSAVGKGLVTRAARVIIDWAIDERGIHRVEWRVAAANEASIAVARRLGMTKDGVLRESHPHRGTRYDVEIWSVLAPEWRAARVGGIGVPR
ncbi:GNAT family N-acetyltransferase [Amycolatopsis nigrescens]|uniref:GNAT family N-acetyltransferase n=1 Tax=Amycolatopsis nigrescens TaxID=381445 RepID=UPI00039AD152|nr:GNAT family protein [Amycolatopsis nigrescens]